MSLINLIVIGVGNMGGAILDRGLAGGIFAPESILAIDPSPEKLAPFAARGVRTLTDLADLAKLGPPASQRTTAGANLAPDATILWAVKPQLFPQAAAAFRQAMPALAAHPSPSSPRQTCISIMAGVTIARIASATGFPETQIVRTMPTMAARLGQSATAVATSAAGAASAANTTTAAGAHDNAALTAPSTASFSSPGLRFLACSGPLIPLPEHLMDAYTAAVGSGPAYFYYLAQAMLAAATDQGIPPDAARLALATTLQAAATSLLQSPTTTPQELRAQITSKAGTTEAGIAILDQANVMATIKSAIARGTNRSRELSGQ